MGQLALPLRLDDHAVFASFLATGNESVVAELRCIAEGDGGGCWLWGLPSTGKTHLLQAACELAGDRSVYLPMSDFAAADPAILDGLESRELLCIDDLDAVAGGADWEQALFALWNRVQDSNGQIVVAAAMASRECPFELPDLKSRLNTLPVYQLHSLDEEQRVSALQLRARHRGLELPSQTARYMLNRSRRDMASLYRLLDKLDLEALRAKRRLTIPFVSSVLRGSDGG